MSIQPQYQGKSVAVDQLVKRTTVTWMTNRGEGESFAQTKQGTRDPEYGFFSNYVVRDGHGYGSTRYDKVMITFEDLASTELPLYRHLCRVATIALPVERHPDYVCRWNHNVVQPAGDVETALDEAEWDVITEITTLGATGKPEGQWKKANQSLSDKFTYVFQATKPGQQSFLVPAPEVTQIVYTRTEATVNTAIQSVSKLGAPLNTFGLTLDPNAATSEGWLVTGVEVRRINDWYELTMLFKFMKYGWDTDFYDTV